MDLYELVDAVAALVQQRGRVAYRSLKKQFQLDDEGLEDLKEELLFSHPAIAEVDERGLIWKGDGEAIPALAKSASQNQTPISYTPQHLAERILAEHAAMESRGSTDGERKTITALFADLKGSTALIEGLDPEDARAIIDPALQLMMDAVHRYDGYVAQALGDGIFALFGAPIAHEDHPQRALYAALRMQEEMRAYADQSRLKGSIPLQMRVGINTGEVVVRSIRKDDLHTDYVPVGHSTNLAARMEQLATPGSIVISEYTRKLTEGYFDLKALGAADIKGVEAPLNVYEVLGAGPLRTRLQVSARRGLTRFVGRHGELDHMKRALDQAQDGHGQIVGVMGEPGLGKSRLFYEFVGAYNHTPLRRHGCLVLEAFSVSHGKASPYLPLIEMLKAYFHIEPTDEERIRKEKVTGRVLTLDRSLEETLLYLFSLLGIDDSQSSLQQMDAQIRRQQTFEALKKLFLRESLNQPLIFIFEDLHWLDTETQGFLDTLSESVASANVLLLVNYRPEYRHAWGHKTYYTQLLLAPLGKAEADELLTFLLGNDASLAQLKELVLERTEGTPFFMEEVVQTLAEEGTLTGDRGHYHLETTPTALHISPTVQGVLAARIDRLNPEEKALLQQLAVIGRQFPLSLITQVVPQSEAELYRVLASLQAKEFLYEQPAVPEVEYLFKHALTQEVAYGTVLQDRRKTLHERTAQSIEHLYRFALDGHYSELAHHYTSSGNAKKAVEYLQLAGQQAAQRSANAEAIVHLSTALELLTHLPHSAARDRQELPLQIALVAPLMHTKGYSAPELESVYTRARELCQQFGKISQLGPVYWGLCSYYLVRGDMAVSRESAEQFLATAQRLQDQGLSLAANVILGALLFWLGELPAARRHLEHGVALYDPQQHAAFALLYGQDLRVWGLTDAALALWCSGYPDQAEAKNQEALQVTRELSHPPSLALAYDWIAIFQQCSQKKAQRVQEWVEAAMSLSTEHGLPDYSVWETILLGWAMAEQGRWEEGVARIRQGLATQGPKEFLRSYCLALLAEAYTSAGQPEKGLATLKEALAVTEQNNVRWYEAELYRLKGELTLHSGNESPQQTRQEAEACFYKSLEVAQRQEAKSWELRAATSLARLWQSQGKRTEAHDLLAPVYDWFTEGFDTADLKDAKALLDKLGDP